MDKVFSVHDNRCESTQKLHLWSIRPLYGEHPLGCPYNTYRACDTPCPVVAGPSQASQHPSCPIAPLRGQGPTGTFNTGGVLDDFNPWTRIHQPLHQADVAPRHGLLRPQPNYEALHGLFGRLVELD